MMFTMVSDITTIEALGRHLLRLFSIALFWAPFFVMRFVVSRDDPAGARWLARNWREWVAMASAWTASLVLSIVSGWLWPPVPVVTIEVPHPMIAAALEMHYLVATVLIFLPLVVTMNHTWRRKDGWGPWLAAHRTWRAAMIVMISTGVLMSLTLGRVVVWEVRGSPTSADRADSRASGAAL